MWVNNRRDILQALEAMWVYPVSSDGSNTIAVSHRVLIVS